MNVYNVILAGGGGTRFWPISRQATPKQLLKISGEDTLINETIERVINLSSKEHLFIVTNETQVELLKKVVNNKCFNENILAEPQSKNTAAAIGFAAINIMKKYGDGVMCIYPADHYIKEKDKFEKILNKAINIAMKNDKLVTIGIKPIFPSTGYGYINFIENNINNSEGYDVIDFIEKPDFKKACEYIECGNYLWNSGIFIWKVSKILEDFKRYLPKIYYKIEEIGKYLESQKGKSKINEIYSSIPSISVDYGIMERSSDVIVIPSDFGWNDVGSWDALGSIFPTDENGNINRGEILAIDTKGSIIYSEDKLIATIGIKDLIIVLSHDAMLICPKERAQDVKKVVEKLKEDKKYNYL